MNLKNEQREQLERRKHNLLTKILLVSLKKVSVIVYLFFIPLLTSEVTAGQSLDSLFFNQTYYSVFNLEFEKVQESIESMDPEDPARIYFEHLMEAIPVFIWENEEDYNLFKDNTDDRISTLKSIKNNTALDGFVLAEIRLHESILDIKFGKNLYAGINFNKAHRTIEKNIRDYPDFLLQYKTSGLIDVVTGSVPDNYNWLVNLFGFNKDVEDGLDKISIASGYGSTIEMESRILNAATQIFLLGGKLESEIIPESNTAPFLFKYIASFLYNKNGNGEKSFSISEELINSSDKKLRKLPQAFYLYGINLLQRGDYKSSINYLNAFRSEFTGYNLVKDSDYKLSLAYQILGMNDSSEYTLKRVLSEGNAFTESDKYAQRTAESNKLPIKEVNQLRLFTDGGYFSNAEQLIEENDSHFNTNDKDYLEWEYRKARLYHRSDRSDQSIPYYLEVIDKSIDNQNSYFPPNSCLQLGYIYLSKEMYEESRLYFKKVFDYSRYPYESSIENKAKSGLDQLKSK